MIETRASTISYANNFAQSFLFEKKIFIILIIILKNVFFLYKLLQCIFSLNFYNVQKIKYSNVNFPNDFKWLSPSSAG